MLDVENAAENAVENELGNKAENFSAVADYPTPNDEILKCRNVNVGDALQAGPEAGRRRSDQARNGPGDDRDAHRSGGGDAKSSVKFIFVDGHGWLSVAAVLMTAGNSVA
jgi:hypothetical protein